MTIDDIVCYEEKLIEEELDKGLITVDEYNRKLLELYRDAAEYLI